MAFEAILMVLFGAVFLPLYFSQNMNFFKNTKDRTGEVQQFRSSFGGRSRMKKSCLTKFRHRWLKAFGARLLRAVEKT